MKESISFYTNVLDFRLLGTWPEGGAPSFSILERKGAELHLSTFSGDGTFGSVVSILVDNIEKLEELSGVSGLNALRVGINLQHPDK